MNMFCTAVIVSILVHCAFGLDDYNPVQRQKHLPSIPIDDSFLTSLGIKEEDGVMIYPNFAEDNWNIPQTGSNALDSGIPLKIEFGASTGENTRDLLSNYQVLEKRPNVKLIPRIGRKKRSVTDEQIADKNNANKEVEQGKFEDTMIEHIWDEDNNQDYLFRTDKRRPRNRVVFIPRIGKKSFAGTNNIEEKRAVVFIPRIGRASFLPQLIRYKPQYRVSGRAVFIPRIG